MGGRPQSRTPSLWPKEHGVYAEVAFPLLTALGLATPTLAALALAVAVVVAFLIHEPMLVLLGIRGRRTRSELGARAWKGALLLGLLLALSGGVGLWLAPVASRWACLVPAAAAAALVPLIVARRERSTLGEVLVPLCFASAMIPVALAATVALRTAVVAAAVWLGAFVLGTLAVRRTLEHAKGQRGPMRLASPLTALLASVAALSAAPWSGHASLALLPMAAVTLFLSWRPPSAKKLRTVGWALVAGNVLTFVGLLLTLR